MNVYAITFRQAGYGNPRDTYNILAESVEDALEGVKAQVKKDYGSDFTFETMAVSETARDVLIPKVTQKALRLLKSA